ncbi:MAG: hypothetical protein FJ266_01595 [Planctomycetes bacterium]|nr:hypothetical protein [Planctomycetota bacterium]
MAFGSQEKISYKARGKECRECEHFGICTTSKKGRWVVRMVKQEQLKKRLEEIYHEEKSQNFYENWLAPETVIQNAKTIERLINKLRPLAT